MKNIFFTDESVEINWFNSEKYFFADESVKKQITDSISENLTDSDLESRLINPGVSWQMSRNGVKVIDQSDHVKKCLPELV